jgi:hypothetical protein
MHCSNGNSKFDVPLFPFLLRCFCCNRFLATTTCSFNKPSTFIDRANRCRPLAPSKIIQVMELVGRFRPFLISSRSLICRLFDCLSSTPKTEQQSTDLGWKQSRTALLSTSPTHQLITGHLANERIRSTFNTRLVLDHGKTMHERRSRDEDRSRRTEALQVALKRRLKRCPAALICENSRLTRETKS